MADVASLPAAPHFIRPIQLSERGACSSAARVRPHQAALTTLPAPSSQKMEHTAVKEKAASVLEPLCRLLELFRDGLYAPCSGYIYLDAYFGK